VYPESGFKTITGVQLLNALALMQQKKITFRCFQTYMGLFSIIATREAAKRARTKNKLKGGTCLPCYRISELARLCRLTEGKVKRDLQTLQSEKVVSFCETDVRVLKEALPEAQELLSLVRSPTRPVPVPRIVLRFLAHTKSQSVSMAMIAYMLRGLTLSREGAEVKGSGSSKLSWISKLTGLSERGARYARKELIRLGWIQRDTGSKQWKLNRDGAYFSINLAWRPVNKLEREAKSKIFAPPHQTNRPPFALPYKDRKTPYGSKNQKSNPSGFLKLKDSEQKGEDKPTLKNIQLIDLFNLSRCEELYRQCVIQGIVKNSESSVLNFLSAAIRARSIKFGDPARVFITIVKRQLWSYVTCAQEEVARRALARIREINPLRFRPLETAKGLPLA
jgi:hypothetical protein